MWSHYPAKTRWNKKKIKNKKAIVWNTKFNHPAKCELKRIKTAKVPEKDWNAMVSKTLERSVVSDLEKIQYQLPWAFIYGNYVAILITY